MSKWKYKGDIGGIFDLFLKLIKDSAKYMTKGNLRSGMIIETEDGDRGIIIDTHLGTLVQFKDCWEHIENLDIVDIEEYPKIEIVAVYNIEYGEHIVTENWYSDSLTLLWERKEKSETEIKIEQLEKQAEEIQKTIKELKGKLK